MLIAEYVATLLDDLTEITPSTDRLGKPNWECLGSANQCWRCGGTFGKDFEPGSHVRHHIIPSSEGGSNSPDNKSLLCSNCHSVVHKYYLPTGKIGRKRTREGALRLVGRFKDGTEISQKLPSADHALGDCTACGVTGIVTGVTEGYWNGEGLLVLLDCQACGLKFAEPFIGTSEAPAVDQISAMLLAISSGVKSMPDTLPAELQTKVQALFDHMMQTLREMRSEMNSTVRNAKRSGVPEHELESLLKRTREKYIRQMKSSLPEASKLTEECRPYIKPEK